MSQHSPGPWAHDDGVIYSVPLDRIVMVPGEDGQEHPHHRGMVALVYGHHIDEQGRDARDTNRFTGSRYTHDHNVALMTAAPDLRDALAEFVRIARHLTPVDPELVAELGRCERQAEAALRMAEAQP